METEYREIPGLERGKGRMEDEIWYSSYQGFLHYLMMIIEDDPPEVFKEDEIKPAVLYAEYLKWFRQEFNDQYESFPDHKIDELLLFCNYWAPLISDQIEETKKLKELYPPEPPNPGFEKRKKEYLKAQGITDLRGYGFEEDDKDD